MKKHYKFLQKHINEFNNKSEKSLEIKNTVFTDLFFDQNNIVYVHANGESKSIMLNKKTAIHQLEF